MPGPNISVTFCEDIRTEKTEKLLVIGVFVDEMMVNDFPASVRLAMWIRIFELPPAATAVRVVVSAPGGWHAETEPIAVYPKRRQNHVLLPTLSVPVAEAGEIVVHVRDNDGNDIGADKLSVLKGVIPA